WHQLIVYHPSAFPEVRNIFAGMAAGLSNKEPEVFHEVDTDWFFPVNFRALNRFPDRRVEILLPPPIFQEERLMINPGAEEGDFVVGDTDPFCQHLAGPLNAVAKSNVGATGCGVDRPAICS